jgi:DNA-binding CsgD family transcriptional regulator
VRRRDATPNDLDISRVSVHGSEYVVFSWPPGRAPLPRSAALPSTLTPAERTVHALVLAGLSDTEIAAARRTTRSTVTKQIDSVFRKLGVRSRRELIARAARVGSR